MPAIPINPDPCDESAARENWAEVARQLGDNGFSTARDITSSEDLAYMFGWLSDGTPVRVPVSSAPTRFNGVRISQMNGYVADAEQVMIHRTNNTLGYDDSGAC